MIVQIVTKTKAKPFLKWAGGKTQLLPTIHHFLPVSFEKEKITYIEPFVGGGAVLFFLLQRYPNIKKAVINDINPHLINVYMVIREQPHRLIDLLKEIQICYHASDDNDSQREFYLLIRDKFNAGNMNNVEEAAYMIFMNRTCFNGLYRENSRGGFNVPFGRYVNPTICDEELIISDSELLQRVEILNGDFSLTKNYMDGYTFMYLDPPYRPLSSTARFNSYVKGSFDDKEQIRLKDFYVELSNAGCYTLLSNSDGKYMNPDDCFFDELYKDFFIERVNAKRSINSNPNKRGAITELLIRNYHDCLGQKECLF